jgi:lipopolysaccharide biosynthesis glycosyltransferase
MAEPISVVVASDANMLPGLQTTLASAAVTEKSRPLHFHLLDGGLPDWQWDSLVATVARVSPRSGMTRHRIETSTLAKFQVSGELPMMTYARVLTPLFVPDPFAIYVDCDFLVSRPMSDLLPYLDSGKAIVAARQGEEKLQHDCPWGRDLDLSGYPYANAGIMLFNLEKWRKDDISARTVAFLEKESINCRYHDQTAMNWLWRDDIEFVPTSWNSFANEYSAAANAGPSRLVAIQPLVPARRAAAESALESAQSRALRPAMGQARRERRTGTRQPAQGLGPFLEESTRLNLLDRHPDDAADLFRRGRGQPFSRERAGECGCVRAAEGARE